MIERVRGRLLAAEESWVVIEVGGIALRLEVGVRLARRLATLGRARPEAGELVLFTHLVLRPDQWQLFGFEEEESRRLFRILLGIPGVGPRMAIALLSHLSIASLQE
ncbi:MAG: Holliday junction branch migration protein RuvA, partial [Candidatus Eisenbacteria bacterium]|nr:Holliday junction branch migration protein RuvA [Candidatus Eisenbacteria bacterium]